MSITGIRVVLDGIGGTGGAEGVGLVAGVGEITVGSITVSRR